MFYSRRSEPLIGLDGKEIPEDQIFVDLEQLEMDKAAKRAAKGEEEEEEEDGDVPIKGD